MKKLITLLLLFLGVFVFSVKAQITASSFASAVNFTSGTTTSSHPYWSGVGDLDGDGKVEVVATNSGESYISLFRNIASPGSFTTSSFASKVDIACLAGPLRVCISDMDGDGKNDIVLFYTGSSYFSIYKNTTTTVGTITFATRQDFATPTSGNGTVADINGDGKAEVMVVNYGSAQFNIYRNTSTSGSVSFASALTFSTGGGPAYIVAKDYDGDGKIDLAVSNYCCSSSNTVTVYLNTTSSVSSITLSSTVVTLATGSLPNGLIAGDIDGDGKAELICANYNGATVSVYRNTSSVGSISFGSQVTFATTGTQGPQEMGVADFDGDGKLDLVVGNTNSTNNVSVYRNTASLGYITTSSFATRVDFSTGAGAAATVGDFDGDSKPDILSSNGQTTTITVLRNLCISTAPTAGGSSISFSGINNTSMTVSFTTGNGTRRIVLCKAASAVNTAPVSGTGYTANSNFSTGSQLGTGNYAVYSDTGSTFTLNGLSANTTYYFAVFEYNGIGGFANYLTTAFSYITGSQATTNTTYYFSKSTGNLNSLSTWGVNIDGTGTNPTSFSNPNSYYFAINNPSPTINGNLTITGGNTAFVVGDGVNTFNFSLPSGLTLTTDTFLLRKNSTITVNGNLAGLNNFFEDTSTAQFLATSAQNIPTASYYNLIVGSSVKTLNNGNAAVRNSLTMISSINLNNYILLLGTSASQTGSLNVVTGTLYGGTFMRWFNTITNSGSSGLFPIGTATNYRPVQINYTTAPTTAGTLAATFVNSIPSNTGLPVYDVTASPVVQVNKVGRNGTWVLTPGTLAGGQFTGTFTASGFWGVSNDSVLRLVRRTNSASAWTASNGAAQTTTGSNASPVLSRTGMTLFGEFGVGGDSGTNALPVKLIILTVRQQNDDAILSWQTASEINSDYFEIQRTVDLSAGATQWETFGKVAASGNSNEVKDYSFPDLIKRFIDQNVKTIYYRLNQVDKDGFVSTSDIITLNLKSKLSNITLYPLPISNILTAATSNAETISELCLFDMSGKQILSSNNGQMDVTTLAEGMYIVRVTTDKQTYYQKITK